MRFLILTVIVMLEGCVGLVTMHDSAKHYSADEASRRFYFGEPSSTHPPVMTKEELQKRLGKPERIWRDGNLEKWRYTHEFSWFAVIPYIVIPIPLGIPTGRTGDTYTFDGDILVSEDDDKTATMIALCGYLVLGGTDHAVISGFGCTAHSGTD